MYKTAMYRNTSKLKSDIYVSVLKQLHPISAKEKQDLDVLMDSIKLEQFNMRDPVTAQLLCDSLSDTCRPVKPVVSSTVNKIPRKKKVKKPTQAPAFDLREYQVRVINDTSMDESSILNKLSDMVEAGAVEDLVTELPVAEASNAEADDSVTTDWTSLTDLNVTQVNTEAKTDVAVTENTVANITSILGIDSLLKFQLLFNPSSLYKKAYVVLDSFNKRSDVSDDTIFSWYYTNSRHQMPGTVTSTTNLKNIVAMQIYQPVIPKTTLTATDDQRVSILVDGFKTQAYKSIGDRYYHYLCRVIPVGAPTLPLSTHVALQIENFNDGLYKFNNPITSPSVITLSFGTPDTLLHFYPDAQGAAIGLYGNPTPVTTVQDHNLASGSTVYITGFKSISGFDDNLINNPLGVIATVTGPNTFTIPVDTSTGVFYPVVSIVCKYQAFRLIVAFEFTCIA